MPISVLIILGLLILVLAYFALKENDDWPDDDHLEPPRGGMTI